MAAAGLIGKNLLSEYSALPHNAQKFTRILHDAGSKQTELSAVANAPRPTTKDLQLARSRRKERVEKRNITKVKDG